VNRLPRDIAGHDADSSDGARMTAVAQGWAVAAPTLVLEPHRSHGSAVSSDEGEATAIIEAKELNPRLDQEPGRLCFGVLTHRPRPFVLLLRR
jgi:hypothetical protein